MKTFIIFTICLFIQSAIATTTQIRTTPLPGTVALTFDDGPSPIYTPQVLSILKSHHIKATFFVMGALAKKYPELIKMIAADGHSVQIHTMTHPKLTKLSLAQLNYEIGQSKKIIANILGNPPVCLRPPYGLINQRIIEFAKTLNIITVPIGFNSFDYENRGSEKLTKWVVQNVRSGMVILLHDGYKARQQTVKALPEIIKGIKKKGLGFSEICIPAQSDNK